MSKAASERQTYKDLIFSWVLLDVGLPVFFIGIFWPVGYYLEKAHSFDRVFHTADLMPMGAILLLAAMRELETEIRLNRISAACSKRRTLGLVIVITFLFLYALARVFGLLAAIPDSESTAVDARLNAISWLSIASLIFSFLYSLFIKSSVLANLRVGNVP